MTIGLKLKSLRENKNLTQDQVAKILGVTKQTIYKYETGITTNIPLDKIEQLADIYDVKPNEIVGWDNEENANFYKITNIFPIPDVEKEIPLIGTIAAGTPTLAEENIQGYIKVKNTVNADFCLTIKGDSMINANIHDGDVVFIKKQSDVDDGEIAAVLIEDEATLKRVYKIGNIVQLRAENPKYEPITLNGDKQVFILGKATYKLSEIL